MSYPPSDTNSAAPIPVQSLAYSLPSRQGRPGIITAIAVLCIIIACMSGIGSFLSGTYSFSLYFFSKMSSKMAASSSTVTTSGSYSTTVVTTSPPTVNIPSGSLAVTTLSIGDAGVAVNVLRPMLSLDSSHTSELNRLLRRHGRQILTDDEDSKITTASVRDGILKSTTQPANSSEPAQFWTAQGRVDIYSYHAMFLSTDGSLEVRTSVRHASDQTIHHAVSNPAAGTPINSTVLSPAQIKQIIAAVNAYPTVKLNSGQTKALEAAISDPNQTLVTQGATTPVISALKQPNGNVAVTFDTGNMLVLSPQGAVVSVGPPKFNFNIQGGVAVTLIVEAVASAGLAIYLLIIGILMVRPTFRGRTMLVIYAWLKIPLAIIVAIGWPILIWEMANGITTSAAAGMATPGTAPFVVWGIVAGVLGIAFPIGVLIALRSRTVRNYYNSVVAEG